MEVRICFGDTRHIYDVREKRYLGFGNKTKVPIREGDTAIFALLPDTVDGISVRMPDKVRRGDDLVMDIEVHTEKPDHAYENVLNIKIYDPDGEYHWLYSENVSTAEKTFQKILHMSYNEKKGIWKARIKDVASGVCAEKRFEVY